MRRVLWVIAGQGVLALSMIWLPLRASPRGDEVTELKVKDVVLVEANHQAVILMSPAQGDVVVPLVVDALSGAQVAAQLHGENHGGNIAQQSIEGLGARLVRVVLDDVQGAHSHAHLQMLVGRRPVSVESDPAASVTLALAAGVPVVASSKVMASSVTADQAQRFSAPAAPAAAPSNQGPEILSL